MSELGGLLGAGLGLAGNIFSGIQGARLGRKQMGLGQDMIDEAQKLSAAYQRPEMQTPEAINMMMQLSQGRQYQNLPGMNIAQNQLGQSTASGLNAINEMSSGAEGIGAIANLYSNQMKGQQNLAMQNAQYQDQNQQQYLGALNDLGNWQQKAWQWNKADPYLMAQEKASQLEMMGRQGQWEGLKNKMGSWAETFKGAGGFLGNLASQAGAAGLFDKKIPIERIGTMQKLNPIMPDNPFQNPFQNTGGLIID